MPILLLYLSSAHAGSCYNDILLCSIYWMCVFRSSIVIIGQFMGGLSCFDVDTQAFVRLAFSKKSRLGKSIWDGLEMTGHSAVLCSRGLLMVGGLLPRGLTLTMSTWALDVFRGCPERTQRRSRRSTVLGMAAAAGGCAPS